jgi:hypothetical protein
MYLKSYGIAIALFLVTGLLTRTVHAEEKHTWYRLTCPPRLFDPDYLTCTCIISEHSPAEEYEQYAFFGAQIVDKGNDTVEVVLPERTAELTGGGGTFFRTEEACGNYLKVARRQQEQQQRQYEQQVAPYR